jgi:hypothetical protein
MKTNMKRVYRKSRIVVYVLYNSNYTIGPLSKKLELDGSVTNKMVRESLLGSINI